MIWWTRFTRPKHPVGYHGLIRTHDRRARERRRAEVMHAHNKQIRRQQRLAERQAYRDWVPPERVQYILKD